MEPSFNRGGTTYIFTLAQFSTLVDIIDGKTVRFKEDIISIKEFKDKIQNAEGVTGEWYTHKSAWGAHVVSSIARLSSEGNQRIPVTHIHFAEDWTEQYYSAKKPEAKPNEIELAQARAYNIIAETDKKILNRQSQERGTMEGTINLLDL